MPTTDPPQVRPDEGEVSVVVKPTRQRGWFWIHLDDVGRLPTRWPILDAAQILLSRGLSPDTPILFQEGEWPQQRWFRVQLGDAACEAFANVVSMRRAR
jgi:hypothetical protein